MINKSKQLHPVSNAKQWLDNAYQKNLPWFVKYILNNNGSVEEAKDIFQDSLSIAWINLREGKFEGQESDFHAYLRQICKYKWIDEIKRKSKLPKTNFEITKELENNHLSEDIEEVNSGLQFLGRSLAKLEEKCKSVLSMYYYQKTSLGIIAEKLGVTAQSAKTIKYRCMMRLREAYLQIIKENEEL